MSEPLRSRPRTLARRSVPLSPNLPGAEFIPRADRVLRHMAMYSDEREWRRMYDSTDAISSAWRQRQQHLLRDGWEICEGDSGSARANELRDFVASVFAQKSLRWPTLLVELLDVIWLGWRPIEIEWGSVDWQGVARWAPVKLTAHDPERFQFGIDGETLVYKPTGAEPNGLVWKLDQLPPSFLVPSYGSSRSPYGRSWMSAHWLLWFVANEFRKMTSVGIKRALGIFKATKGSGTIKDAIALSETVVDDNLRAILKMLDQNSVIVEASGWSLDHLATINMGSEMREFWDQFDRAFRVGIVGQTLTSQMDRAGGSFAAAKVHDKTLDSYVAADGRQLSSWFSDLITPLIDLNFGPQAPEDYPVWRAKSLRQIDLEATRLAWEMGAPIDAGRIAQNGVPIVPPDEMSQRHVLQKVAMPAPDQIAPTSVPATARARLDDPRQVRADLSPELAKLIGAAAREILDDPDP